VLMAASVSADTLTDGVVAFVFDSNALRSASAFVSSASSGTTAFVSLTSPVKPWRSDVAPFVSSAVGSVAGSAFAETKAPASAICSGGGGVTSGGSVT
jgi:hypothetical protein